MRRGAQASCRLRFTGWGEYEVVHNPCEALLGEVFARMAPCTHYLRERLPGLVRRSVSLKAQLIDALGAAGAPAVPVLMGALAERQPALRLAACNALGDIGDPQAGLRSSACWATVTQACVLRRAERWARLATHALCLP